MTQDPGYDRRVRYSVVVVTWQSAGHLSILIGSMNRHLRGDPELVVVDNASSDDVAREAARWRGETRVIELDDNVGFGQANNIGVAAARHDSIVLINPDTELVDGSLDRLADRAVALQALVGPRLLNADHSIQPSASGSPIGLWPWVGALVPQGPMPPAVQRQVEPWRLRQSTTVAWLTGACIAAPRGILRYLGPFDPAIHLYSEDLDLGLRAGRVGIPSVFAPEACRLVHFGDGSSSRRFPDAGRRLSVANRQAVVRRLYGTRAERCSSAADILRLVMRASAKRLLARDATLERQWLRCYRGDGRRAELPPFPALAPHTGPNGLKTWDRRPRRVWPWRRSRLPLRGIC